MAVYRKKLVDKDGNTIIPAVGDVYGTVYTATLSSATGGGRADYEFTPDTPVENNKVYAVMFPAPTVNNATIILGDGVVSGSILVPPVSATDSPNYELLTTDMINDTEPLLLMYSGVQWVCLNQKKKVATADLENKAVKSNKIDWATLKTGEPKDVGSGIASRTITADSVGFIVINTACANNAYSAVYLNDTSLGRTQGGAAAFTWLQTTVFVAKGDVVRITTSDNGGNAQITGVKFVPIY